MKTSLLQSLSAALIAAISLVIFLWLSPVTLKPTTIEQSAFNGWQKLDKRGNIIPSKQGPWRCVKDPATGLIWENKTTDEGVSHYQWTYSQEQGQSLSQRNCNVLNECTARDYIEHANRQQWCGKNNWRLPTAKELQSLIDNNRLHPEAKINASLFPKTKSSSYWASNSIKNEEVFFYQAVNFQTGEIKKISPQTGLYIRLVAP